MSIVESFIEDSDIKDAVAHALHQADAANLPAWWDEVISASNSTALNDIINALIARGFTTPQIQGWDRGAEYQKDLALFWSLLRGGATGEYGEGWKNLDRRKELVGCPVLVAGIYQKPGGGVGVDEFDFTPITTGPQVASDDLFSLDPDDPRAGEVTRW